MAICKLDRSFEFVEIGLNSKRCSFFPSLPVEERSGLVAPFHGGDTAVEKLDADPTPASSQSIPFT